MPLESAHDNVWPVQSSGGADIVQTGGAGLLQLASNLPLSDEPARARWQVLLQSRSEPICNRGAAREVRIEHSVGSTRCCGARRHRGHDFQWRGQSKGLWRYRSSRAWSGCLPAPSADL